MGLQHSVRAAAVGSERIRMDHHTGWPATPAVVCASGRGPKRADEWLSHRDRWHAALTGSRNSSISYTSCRCDFPNSAIPITPFLKARPALAFTTSSAVVNDAGRVAAVVANCQLLQLPPAVRCPPRLPPNRRPSSELKAITISDNCLSARGLLEAISDNR